MQEQKKSFWNSLTTIQWIGCCAMLAVFLSLIFFHKGCNGGTYTTAAWMAANWNSTGDSSFGWCLPFLCGYMVIHALKKIKAENFSGSMHGMWSIVIACLLYLGAVRTMQSRLAIASIPFFTYGIIGYYWGKEAQKRCFFPVFFVLIGVMPPDVMQSTTSLQILSTVAANWVINLCGIQTMLEGTAITITEGNLNTFNIDGGCSGLRSLISLFTISFTWAFLADQLATWKRIILVLSAFPLAIITNILRISSIFLIAQHIDADFAGSTWHDWSGLLIFFPTGLIGLTVLHGLLSGEIPFLKRRRTIITRKNATQN